MARPVADGAHQAPAVRRRAAGPRSPARGRWPPAGSCAPARSSVRRRWSARGRVRCATSPAAPGDVDIALGRGLARAGGQPGVIAVLSVGQGSPVPRSCARRRRFARRTRRGWRRGWRGWGWSRDRNAWRRYSRGRVHRRRRSRRRQPAPPAGCGGRPPFSPARAAVERQVGHDELGVRGRGLAGDEELARVAGVGRDRRPDVLPVPVVSDADVRGDTPSCVRPSWRAPVDRRGAVKGERGPPAPRRPLRHGAGSGGRSDLFAGRGEVLGHACRLHGRAESSTSCEQTAKKPRKSAGRRGWATLCWCTPSRDRSRPLVLVVEDEPEIAALMRDFLEADGFRVRLAADAEEAARALCRRRRTACCST